MKDLMPKNGASENDWAVIDTPLELTYGFYPGFLLTEWYNSSGIGSLLFVAALLWRIFFTSSNFSLAFSHLIDSGTIKYEPSKSSEKMWTDNVKVFHSLIKYATTASKNSPIWNPIPEKCRKILILDL